MKNNIVLCGFMGCGKSTVGRALAARLNYDFCDSDAVIEQREGISVSSIFAQKGEGYFRELEKSVIRELSDQKGLIIATGGGAVLDPENAASLRKTGLVIFLDITPDAVLKRLEGDTTRPLLMRDDKEAAVNELMTKRKPLYATAGHHTVNAELPVEKVVEKIVELYVKSDSKS